MDLLQGAEMINHENLLEEIDNNNIKVKESYPNIVSRYYSFLVNQHQL